MPRIQVLLVFSWMGMLMHQFEEYGFPGGFPIISNMAGLGETEHPERYPLNARQSFLSNVYIPEKAGQLWWGIPGSILMLLLTFIVPILIMKDKNSPYPFEERELYGYHAEHVKALWEERKARKQVLSLRYWRQSIGMPCLWE